MGPTTPTGQRPRALTPCGFGLFPVRSPLLGESRLISFPGGTKMFQFPPCPSVAYGFSHGCLGFTQAGFPIRAPPGRHARTRLPEAFRSVPRPSSAPGAKASTACPYSLTRDAENPFPELTASLFSATLCSVVKVRAGLLARFTLTSPFPARQRMAAGSRLRTPSPGFGGQPPSGNLGL
jgi:hypothetical protein